MSVSNGSPARRAGQLGARWGALQFPTALHEQVANRAASLVADDRVDTVLVVNSCARGQGVSESDLDMAVLLDPAATVQDLNALEARWLVERDADPLIAAFEGDDHGRPVHLDFFDGQFVSPTWDDGGGPDSFEVEIGNRVAHAVPLTKPGAAFVALQTRWLPYYVDDLRRDRLRMVQAACIHDLDRIAPLVRRHESFSALAYLNKAFQEFLQALFVSRRVYPLSYSKWIREQVEIRLGLPELYGELPPILSVADIESGAIADRAMSLRQLLERWTTSESAWPE